MQKSVKSLYFQNLQQIELSSKGEKRTALQKLSDEAWAIISPHTHGGTRDALDAYRNYSSEVANNTSKLSPVVELISYPEKLHAFHQKLGSWVSQLEQGVDIEKLDPRPSSWEADFSQSVHHMNTLASKADAYLIEAEQKAFAGTNNAELKAHLEQAAQCNYEGILKKYSATASIETAGAHIENNVNQVSGETPLKSPEPVVQPTAGESPKPPVKETPHTPAGSQVAAGGEKAVVQEAEHAAEGLWAKFAKMHWGKKTAVVGGTAIIGGTIGYWAFKSKQEEAPQQSISAER